MQHPAPTVVAQAEPGTPGLRFGLVHVGTSVAYPFVPMKIAEILARGPSYSFEFFPPRTPAAEIALTAALEELEPLGPSYVSVTYGAGGSTREKTHEIVTGILRDTAMTPMAHLTCVGHSRAELEEIVSRYRDSGIENILALGGDPPPDVDLPEGELKHAIELVQLVRESATSRSAWRAPRAAPAVPEPRERPPPHRGEARRRGLRDHAVLLRRRALLRSRRQPARARRRQARDPRHHAGDDDRQHQADVAAPGLRVPALARRQARSGRRRSRRGVRRRRRRGDEARAP